MPISLQSNALTSLENAKMYLKIPALETTQDDIVKLLINSASDELERETDRKLKARTGLIDYQDGRGQNIIMLREWPVTAITELRIDPRSKFTDASTLIPAADYDTVDEGMSVLYLNAVFPRGNRNIKVTYNAGYSIVPADLEHACLWLVAWYHGIRNAGDIGRVNTNKEGESAGYLQVAPGAVTAAIMRHKRTDFGVPNAGTYNV